MKLSAKNIQAILKTYGIQSLCTDSRQAKPGTLFFALKAEKALIQQAFQQGASAVVCSQHLDHLDSLQKKKNTLIRVNDVRAAVGYFAHIFYKKPSSHLSITGVTGTNGKTSVTHFLAQAFEKAGYKSAVIGTVGAGPLASLQPCGYTTPDALQLHQWLSNFYDQGITHVALEASSHGLVQKRLASVALETGVFTNLSRDHLDYHKTFSGYARAKFKLFSAFRLKHAVLNLDDPYGLAWAHRLNRTRPLLRLYGVTTQVTLKKSLKNSFLSLVFIKIIKTAYDGLSIKIDSPWGKGTLVSPLWGAFNALNLSLVLTVLCSQGFLFQYALSLVSQIKNAPGRLQLFSTANKPLVIVDYAHTPDALLKALQAVRAHLPSPAKIICVFGCGGDRDKGKRKQMGEIAGQYADEIVLTNDNPRTEDPQAILKAILSGMPENKTVMIETDRKKAIAYALSLAGKKDCVLVAGKGHETLQDMGHEKKPYSDILTVQTLLKL